MRETSRQKSLTVTRSDESVRVIKELLTMSRTFVMCFEEKTKWYVRLLDERCSGRPGIKEHRDTGRQDQNCCNTIQ